jgi:hypothetical protein
MTSDRPYRKGTSFANAIQEIRRCANTQFDPEVVRAFLDIGEEGLIRIKEEMALKKLQLPQAELEATETEAELSRLTDLDDDSDVPTPGRSSATPERPEVKDPVKRSATGTQG